MLRQYIKITKSIKTGRCSCVGEATSSIHPVRALRPEASQGPYEADGNPVHLLRHPHGKRGAVERQNRAESTSGGCLKRKHAHGNVLS